MSRPLPPLGALQLLRALSKPARRPPGQPPELCAVFHLPALDRQQLRRYRADFGFSAAAIPLTYYAVLAQRAQLALMLEPAFPFRIAGVIHAEQQIRRVADVDPAAPLALHGCLETLPPSAHGNRSVQVTVELRQADVACVETVSRLVVQRGAADGRSAAADGPPAGAIAGWQFSAAAVRAYARLSGDVNPIHLSRLTARLFGLRQPIVHGMATLARVTAACEAQRQRPVAVLAARFRRPIPVGSPVTLHADTDSGAFDVRCNDRIAVSGSLHAAP